MLYKLWKTRLIERDFLPKGMVAGPFIPGVDAPMWKFPCIGIQEKLFEDHLFNNAKDPTQDNNVAQIHPEQVQKFEDRLRKRIEEVEAPEETRKRLHL